MNQSIYISIYLHTGRKQLFIIILIYFVAVKNADL